MTAAKSYITIKGTKDGLVLYMDDSCAYQDLMMELEEKLDASKHHMVEGPLTRVTVRLGYRFLTTDQEQEIKDLIRSKGKLVVDEVQSEVVSREKVREAREQANIHTIHKTVRSGQIYRFKGNVLVLGDINPGGCVQASGNIYVLGTLRGTVHAGCQGDQQAIIAASVLQPTQLRIAHVVGRSPDQTEEQVDKEFAYIENDQIIVEKIQKLAVIRPEWKSYV